MFKIIDQAKVFVVGLQQRQNAFPFMQLGTQVFLDALGETRVPKVRAVPLPAKETSVRLGLFEVTQGRRPGRKRDFSNTRRVGGLIVNDNTAPACGVFEYSDKPGLEEPLDWPFPTAVQQILRTDGRTWLALVRRGKTNSFAVVEEYILPDFGHGLEWAMDRQDGALFDAPQELYGFIEFLRRALIPVHEENKAARLAASYCRELVYWFMESDQNWPEHFIYDCLKSHGLAIGMMAPELQAAKILAYGVTLEALMQQFLHTYQIPSDSVQEGLFDDWFSPARWAKFTAPKAILENLSILFHRILRQFADRGHGADMKAQVDATLTTLCRELWLELAEDQPGLDSLSEEAEQADLTWARDSGLALLPWFSRSFPRLTIVNVGTGMGTIAVEVAGMASAFSSDVHVLACEADLVASQIARIRLLAQSALLRKQGKHCVCEWQSTLSTLTEPNTNIYPTSPTILFCDLQQQFPSRAKFLVDGAFDARLGQVLHFLETSDTSPASLRLPVDFLDGKEYVAMRERLHATSRSIWVRYDTNQERPKDKRLSKAFATVIIDTREGGAIAIPDEYEKVVLKSELQFSLLPARLSSGYMHWPSLIDIAAVPPFNGPVERRGMTLIDIDEKALSERVRDYFSDLPDECIADRYPPMMKDAQRFNACLSRRKLRARTSFSPKRLTPYPFRPFDCRTAYLWDIRPLFSDPAPDLYAVADIKNNWFLLASEGDAKMGEGVPAWASSHPCDYDFFAARSRHFPVWIPETAMIGEKIRFGHGQWEVPDDVKSRANLSPAARTLLNRMGYSDPDQNHESAVLLWDFVLAVLYTPAYAQENRDALRLGWPHLPLPGWEKGVSDKDVRLILEEYAALGAAIRRILFGEKMSRRRELAGFATLRLRDQVTPVSASSLSSAQRTLSTNWGIPAKGNAVRPQPGFVMPQTIAPAQYNQIVNMSAAMGMDAGQCLARLGELSADVYVNDDVYWTNVPNAAWEFTIGGRKVLQKWLSYRDIRVLNRPMTEQEMESFSDTTRRLVALTLLGIRLDAMWKDLLEAYGE